MSYASWDPVVGEIMLSLSEAPTQDDPTIFGEILSLSTGSKVDLLNNIPPAATQTNYGETLTLGPLMPYVSSTTRTFTPGRTGWYTVVIPYISVSGFGTGLGTVYDINITVLDKVSATTCADNRTVVANGNVSYPTQLSCIGYFTKNNPYTFTITFGQASTVLDPPELAGGAVTWANVYIFPMLSSIVASGNSPFVILP